jgi:U3 small nucleolar RNA-associated protein 12
MQVAFEKDSHFFWSVGKDGTVKYWDGDKVSTIRTREAETIADTG